MHELEIVVESYKKTLYKIYIFGRNNNSESICAKNKYEYGDYMYKRIYFMYREVP